MSKSVVVAGATFSITRGKGRDMQDLVKIKSSPSGDTVFEQTLDHRIISKFVKTIILLDREIVDRSNILQYIGDMDGMDFLALANEIIAYAYMAEQTVKNSDSSPKSGKTKKGEGTTSAGSAEA